MATNKNSTFSYDFLSSGSTIRLGGECEWDTAGMKWKATMVTQREPEIRFEAWHDDPAAAGLLCCAKWMGHDWPNAPAQRGEASAAADGSDQDNTP